MTTATARAKSKPLKHCILKGVSFPLTVEENQIVAEYPEVFSIDKPGRIAMPMQDAQALGLGRFLQ